jgi:alkylhydroperoxidase family enzyme
MDDPVLEEYLQKVARNAYKVVDEDIASLHQEGLSEDAIWELTVVAALAAGTHRYFHAIHQLQP